jgi:hypothetical protein
MATTLNDYLFDLNVYWAKKRPAKTWDEAGKLAMMIVKASVSGMWSGEKVARVPVKTALNGNCGANFTKAYNNQTTKRGERFEVPLRDLFAFMRVDGDALEIGATGATSGGQSVRREEIDITVNSWMRVFSGLLWSDGTGRIGKGDGNYDVAATTIVLLNDASVLGFEEGDVIVLVAEGAAVPSGGMPTPRAGTLTVTAVNDEVSPYSLEVSAAVNTIVGAVNTDFVSKDVFFGGNNGTIDGVFRWCPITQTEANTALFGVDRSLRPGRLSGRRVALAGNETPYQIVASIGEQLMRSKGGQIKATDDFCIFVPSAEIGELMAEAKQSKLEFKSVTTRSDFSTLCMGTSLYEAVWPDLGKVKIAVDHRLHDPWVPTDQDRTYALLNLATWGYYCGRTRMSWKVREDNGGIVKVIPGTDEYYAEYGAKGNIICWKPNEQVVASTRAAA